MAVNDLTPQLRTRLNRLEKLAGWFVTLAVLLMLSGLGYYMHHTAARKGWFMRKAPFFIFIHTANGLREGDPIKLMGWDVGEITRITPADAADLTYDVYVEFVVREPNYGYVWNDSKIKVRGGILGNRYLELTRGGLVNTNNPLCTYKESGARLSGILNPKTGAYVPYVAGVTKPYWLQVDEPPDFGAQVDLMVQAAKDAIPNMLALTNRVNEVLSNSASATISLVALLEGARPVLTNVLAITTHLKNPQGALGEWLIPPPVTAELTQTLAGARATLGSANTLVTHSDAHMALLVSNLNLSLVSVAGLTSNLHAQVEVNSNLVSSVNRAIIDADDMVQGLKRHWLLRSAFKTNRPAPPGPAAPLKPGPMFRR